MSTACAAWMGTAVLPSLLLTWRCKGCRQIVLELEYDGKSVMRCKCKCNHWNILPDDRQQLRLEDRR